MTPFASVAMLEKLALLKIALCRAPILAPVSSFLLNTVSPQCLLHLADRLRESRGYRSSSSRGSRLKEPLRALSGPMHIRAGVKGSVGFGISKEKLFLETLNLQ